MKTNMKNKEKDNITFLKDSIKVAFKNINMKFSRRKSGIAFTAKSAKGVSNQMWNRNDVKFANEERKHTNGSLWPVHISKGDKVVIDIGFATRSDAREFSRQFKNTLDI